MQSIRSAPPFILRSTLVHYQFPCFSTTAPLWTTTRRSLHSSYLSMLYTLWVTIEFYDPSSPSPSVPLPQGRQTEPGPFLSRTASLKTVLAAPTHLAPLPGFLEHPQIYQTPRVHDVTAQLFFQKKTFFIYPLCFSFERLPLVATFGFRGGANKAQKEWKPWKLRSKGTSLLPQSKILWQSSFGIRHACKYADTNANYSSSFSSSWSKGILSFLIYSVKTLLSNRGCSLPPQTARRLLVNKALLTFCTMIFSSFTSFSAFGVFAFIVAALVCTETYSFPDRSGSTSRTTFVSYPSTSSLRKRFSCSQVLFEVGSAAFLSIRATVCVRSDSEKTFAFFR